MKSVIKLIGIITLLTAFVAAGCENGAPANNEPGDTDDDFIPVTNITGVKTYAPVGTVSLGGKVVPSNATYKTIRWSVIPGGEIEGTLSGDNLTTTEEGFIKVRATVVNGKAEGVNYFKDFNILIEPFVPVAYISGVPNMGEVDEEIYLDGVVHPNDASYTDIVWSVKDPGTTMATIKGDFLTTKAEGMLYITATIVNGRAQGMDFTQDFFIFINKI